MTAIEARKPMRLFQTANLTQVKMRKTTTLQMKKKTVITLQMRNIEMA